MNLFFDHNEFTASATIGALLIAERFSIAKLGETVQIKKGRLEKMINNGEPFKVEEISRIEKSFPYTTNKIERIDQ